MLPAFAKAIDAGGRVAAVRGVADDDTDIALKIYLVSTSNFKKREPYLTGDPRFRHIKKGTKFMVLYPKPSIIDKKNFNKFLQGA